jgi:hypothetical protein
MDARGISAATLGAYPGLTSILTALLFPGWEILAEAGIGSPGSEIIAKADEWRPDLIVVGSHGRTALGRMFFGSVSQRVINDARCSVRVARGRIVEPDVPARAHCSVEVVRPKKKA